MEGRRGSAPRMKHKDPDLVIVRKLGVEPI